MHRIYLSIDTTVVHMLSQFMVASYAYLFVIKPCIIYVLTITLVLWVHTPISVAKTALREDIIIILSVSLAALETSGRRPALQFYGLRADATGLAPLESVALAARVLKLWRSCVSERAVSRRDGRTAATDGDGLVLKKWDEAIFAEPGRSWYNGSRGRRTGHLEDLRFELRRRNCSRRVQ